MKYYSAAILSLMFFIIALTACADTLTDLPVPNPVITNPVVTDPVITDPVITDPVVTDPVFDPVVTDPVVTDPVVTDPVFDPVVTDPNVTDPVVTDPVVTDPASTWQNTISSILNISETPFAYSQQVIPNHVSQNLIADFDNTPANNQIDDRIATLGRVLFYDEQLSANNTISCASCHFQENAFADPARLSVGFQGRTTPRNSMGLANSRFYENGAFFWDERAANLETQTLMPIQDEIEMGLSLAEMTTKLGATDYYPTLFEWSFGDSSVTSDRVSRALSQFVRSMQSFNSRYDAGLAATGNRNQNFPNFTAAENNGKDLFFSGRTDCAACHVDGNNNNVFFFMDQPRNNGLDAGLNSDNGVGDVTNNNNDNGDFKVPSLRNIELTGPYMHDGRLATLEDVIDHYSTGIQDHPNLDNRLRNNGGPVRMNFSTVERANLVAFLKTLTDNSFIQNEAYSDPFN